MTLNNRLLTHAIALPIVLITILLSVGGLGLYEVKVSSRDLQRLNDVALGPTIEFNEITLYLNDLALSLHRREDSSDKIKKLILKINKRIDLAYASAQKNNAPYLQYLRSWKEKWEIFTTRLTQNYDWDRELAVLTSEIGNINSYIQIDVKETLLHSTQFSQRAKKMLFFGLCLGILTGVVFSYFIISSLLRLFSIINEAKNNIETMLDNLDQGFLVIDNNFKIQPQVSRAATDFFGGNVSGRIFSEALPVSSSQRKEVADWLEVLFDGTLMELNIVLEMAPKFFYYNDRYVQLDFKPIYFDKTNKKIKNLICVATDKTLERKFERQAEDEAQLIKVFMAATSDRSAFYDFITEIRKIFKELRKLESLATINAETTDLALRTIHTLKGSLSGCEFSVYAKIIHILESELIDLRGKRVLDTSALNQIIQRAFQVEEKFEQFLSSNAKALGISNITESLTGEISSKSVIELGQQLYSQLGKENNIVKDYIEKFVKRDFGSCFIRYEAMVEKLARRQFKSVKVSTETNKVKVFVDPYRALVNAYVHAYRNAVDHGIEDETGRLDANKPMTGSISLKLEYLDKQNSIQIILQDDGRGIDEAKVKAQAVKKKLISPDKALMLNREQTHQLLFLTGFSTRDDVTELSGRGVGLDAIKIEVERLSGKVWLESIVGQGTKLIAQVPYIDTSSELFSFDSRAA